MIMMNQPNSIHAAKADVEVTRVFDAMRNDIKIARGATEAALASLKEMCARLGIASMYGCAVDPSPECSSSGVIEDAQREMGGLIEMLREMRGLSETVEARL
jgi:hypothetical protein